MSICYSWMGDISHREFMQVANSRVLILTEKAGITLVFQLVDGTLGWAVMAVDDSLTIWS